MKKSGDNARKLYERLYSEKGFYHWFPSLRIGEIAQLISDCLNDSPLILDIGTGDVALFYEVSKLKPKSKIVGIDIASNAIRFAKQRLHQETFIVASAEYLPFRGNCFDGCYSSELIEHIPNPDNMLTDCFRVLKLNGRLVITTPNPARAPPNPYHLRLYNYQELIHIMKKNGFKIHKAIGTQIRFSGYGKLVFFFRKLRAETVYKKILYFLGRLYPLALTLAICCTKQLRTVSNSARMFMVSKSNIPLRLKNCIKLLASATLIRERNIFPKSFANFLLLHLFNLRLEVEKDKKEEELTTCKYKNGAEGAFCLSIDFDLPFKPYEKAELTLREATTKILQLAEHYGVLMSWGICGKLATQEPTVFKQILYSNVNHDLGAHTFSHVDLSSPTCSAETARYDILKCIKTLEKAGRPVSFIFPWNREGHLPLLRELGFVVYRGDQKAKIANPTWEAGLWNIPQTYYLSEKSFDRVNITLKLLDLAIAYGGVFHVWSHPWNMHINRDVDNFMEKVLKPIFKHATKRQREGALWICTMRQLANHSEARRNCHIENFTKKVNEIRLTAHCSIDYPRFDLPPIVTLKIPLSPQTSASKVLIDDEEARKGESWRIVERKRGKRHLFLTLSFEKPSLKVRVVTETHR